MSTNKNLVEELENEFVTLTTENAVEVKFVETQAHHRPEDDIFVVYEICNGFKPSSRDWIGIYKATCCGINDYLNYQWAPRHPRNEKFPHIRGVLFPAGEVDIPNTTDKYLFMYISKANQILARSQRFYISDIGPENDLDLECVENHLDDFALVQLRPENEGNFKIVEDWTTEHTRISGESSPMRKSSDHVTLTSEMSGSGRTLVEIFSSTDEQAVLPYTGSGPVVLYNAKKILTTKISEMMREPADDENSSIVKAPMIQEITQQEEKDIDLEALQVELEYVDNNLNHQKNLVKELSAQVKKISNENKSLNMTNEKLCRNLRDLTNKKETVESELIKCNCRIEELQTVARLQRKGNKTLQLECRLAIEATKRSENTAERLRSELNLLEQQKSDLEENLAKGLDINRNVKAADTIFMTETEGADDNEGWTVATSRKTDRKQRIIEKLENSLAEEKEKCEKLEDKLKECEGQIQQLQDDVKDHQREEQKLVQQICQEKSSSKELDSRVKELTAEMEKMKQDNDRLTQEMALVKRQKMRVKRHLMEREQDLITRIQSLEDALKAAKLISKKAKRQCAENFSQTCFQTSNSNTQTAVKRTAEQACLTDGVCGPAQKMEKKSIPWDEYFENFKKAWWDESAKPKQKDTPSQASQYASFWYQDSLFPFPVFPLADNEELPNKKQVKEPLDLTMTRTSNGQSSGASSSSSLASSSSSKSSSESWKKQVKDESEELLPLVGGLKLNQREKKKPSARKAAAYMVSRQSKPRSQVIVVNETKDEPNVSQDDSKKHGPKKLARKFVCHTRRFKFPGGTPSSSRNHTAKGKPPMSTLTK